MVIDPYAIAIALLAWVLLIIVFSYREMLFEKPRSRVQYKSLDELKRMNPFKFEKYVADLYKSMGYSVQQTKRTGDGGKDIIVQKNGQTYYIECKRYAKPISSSKMRDFVGACALGGKNVKGIYVTTSRFTSDAKSAARRKGIELIDGEKLTRMIRNNKK